MTASGRLNDSTQIQRTAQNDKKNLILRTVSDENLCSFELLQIIVKFVKTTNNETNSVVAPDIVHQHAMLLLLIWAGVHIN